MLPVFQTRLTRGQCGNCFEACVASILEVPLELVPDLGRLVLERRPDWPDVVRACDAAGERLPWPDGADDLYEERMERFLRELGLLRVEYTIGAEPGCAYTEEEWLELVETFGYTWIAATQVTARWRHATVWQGRRFVHQPSPGYPLDPETLGPLREATIFWALDPGLTGRALGRLQTGD